MSYILEAIKKAEGERGNKRLSQAVINEALDRSQHKKSLPWLAIAIFINAIILSAWIGYQIFYKQPLIDTSSLSQVNVDSGYSEPVDNLGDAQESNLLNKESIPDTAIVVDSVQPDLKQINNQKASIDTLDDEPFETDTNTIETNEEIRASVSLDDLIDEDVPVFFSVNKQELKNPSGNDVSSQEIEPNQIKPSQTTPKPVEPIIAAKVDPIPQPVIEIPEPNATHSVDDFASEQVSVEPLPVIPLVRHTDVPSYDELPYPLQKEIPKLTISVHIYNADVAARKVRINGQLLYEGEQVDQQTIVEEITPRGVIIDYAGTLFRKNLH